MGSGSEKFRGVEPPRRNKRMLKKPPAKFGVDSAHKMSSGPSYVPGFDPSTLDRTRGYATENVAFFSILLNPDSYRT